MKHFFLITIVLLFCNCTSNNDRADSNCIQFKIGDFVQYDHEFNTTYQINRGDSIQTEYNANTGAKNISKIVWKSDCEYDLYKIASEERYPLTDSARGKKPLHIIMLETTNEYYIFQAKVDGINFIYSDTIFIAK